jgi:hypothetical protein
MGLLSTKVEVNVNSELKYYESLGYEIPKYIDSKGRLRMKKGTKITVNINDLKQNSHVVVPVECDCCKTKNKVKYAQYIDTINSNTTDGKYACPSCMRKLFRGEKHPAWNTDKTQEEREQARKYEAYSLFVKQVASRDKYICRCCGKRCSKDLRVHHLNGYNWYKEGRIDPENAVCLCESCHDNFHSIYGKGNNTKEQFEEWLGKTVTDLKYNNEPLLSTRKIYCIEDDAVYNSAMEIRDRLGLKAEAHIYKVCNCASMIINNKEVKYKAFTSGGKHFLWFEDYQKATNNDIQYYLNYCNFYGNKRAVICLTTNEIFYTITDAANHYNCFGTNIHKCCNGKHKTCGSLLDGTKLKWMYYDDYLESDFYYNDLKSA